MLSRLTWGILAGVVVAAVLAELASARRAKHHGGGGGADKGKAVQGVKFRAAKSRPRSQHQASQWQPRWRKRPSNPGMTKWWSVRILYRVGLSICRKVLFISF